MNITNFVVPTHHPHGMLEDYRDGWGKESFLVYMLKQAIKLGGFEFPIKTSQCEDELVELGFLEKTGENEYKLTKKSIILLYSRYSA